MIPGKHRAFPQVRRYFRLGSGTVRTVVEGPLVRYAQLLSDRGIALGLVAAGDRERILDRHVLDSVRAAPMIQPGERVADIGSGAGLPGIPLAATLPGASFVLVEPRRKAVAFLELVVERLGLSNVEIVAGRVEDASLEADVATCRAFAPLGGSWSAACRVLRPGGRLIYFAGASFSADDARSLEDPEPPESIEVDSLPPLVMMRRKERALGPRSDQAQPGTSTTG